MLPLIWSSTQSGKIIVDTGNQRLSDYRSSLGEFGHRDPRSRRFVGTEEHKPVDPPTVTAGDPPEKTTDAAVPNKQGDWRKAIEAQLAKEVTLDFSDSEFTEIAEFLRRIHSVNLFVDPEVFAKKTNGHPPGGGDDPGSCVNVDLSSSPVQVGTEG